MENFIIIVILLCIVSGIIFYLYKAKKRGETCIGCPYAKQCGSGQCGGEYHGSQRGMSEKTNR
ncbi:MAG: hypothetical protein K2K63_17600 [Acetatifactor sp.]|nr:hypothetical protein [Acetatifactor sp.]